VRHPLHVRPLFALRGIADQDGLCRVKTKLQVQVKTADSEKGDSKEQHYASTWDALTKIMSAEGLSGLYAGMSGCLIGVASTNFAYFYWYSVVRTLYFKYSKTTAHPSTVVELSLGAVAGALAQLFTIPVAVITTRQQTQSKEERKGILDTAREIIGEDGISGLWRGLKASLVLVVNPSITYGAYERLKDILFPGKKNLSPGEAFGKDEISSESETSDMLTLLPSPWCHVQGSCHYCDPAAHCRQGRPAVQATCGPPGQAFQELRRGYAVHCAT
jgi:Mitochondrial carrier protein.